MEKLPKNLLQSLNLTEAQGRVYVATLELGQSTIQALARKSGVKRSTIYTFIEDLKERSLILETRRKKRTLYSAAHPEHLVELERARLSEIQSLLPELLAIYNQSRTKPRVVFYEGVDGIKEVYGDTLKERKPIIGWSDYEQSKKVLGEYYFLYANARSQRNILYRCIARDTPEAREKLLLSNKELREVKLSQSGDISTELYIYGNKIALINFRSVLPIAILLEDVSIAGTLRSIWEDAWDHL